MASEIDIKKLKVAVEWIGKLANGVNPIDDCSVREDDIVNNIHISRCLFYVADLLEGIVKKKTSAKKQNKVEFQLTQEIVENIHIAKETGIVLFVREINKAIPENMKRLAITRVTQWLVLNGYLEERERSDGHKFKAPTELGTSIGITSTWKEGLHGFYLSVSYDANAQQFILENLLK